MIHGLSHLGQTIKDVASQFDSYGVSVQLCLALFWRSIVTILLLDHIASFNHLCEDILGALSNSLLLLGSIKLTLKLDNALLLRLLVGPHVGLHFSVLIELSLGSASLGSNLKKSS